MLSVVPPAGRTRLGWRIIIICKLIMYRDGFRHHCLWPGAKGEEPPGPNVMQRKNDKPTTTGEACQLPQSPVATLQILQQKKHYTSNQRTNTGLNNKAIHR